MRSNKTGSIAVNKGIILLLSATLYAFALPAQQAIKKFPFYDSGKNRDITINSINKWESHKSAIRKRMEAVMGVFPDTSQLPPMDITYRDSLVKERYTRYLITFKPAAGEDVTAYLYIPRKDHPQQKHPAMLVLHGTNLEYGKGIVAGERPGSHRSMAIEFAERGYVVIAPDYPSMGEQINYDFAKDRYQSGTMKGIFNHVRCVDLLVARKDVDAGKIGAIGHSLGGHNAIFAGAFDNRIKAVVSSCGWTQLDYYDIGKIAVERYGGKLGPWAQDRYMPLWKTYGLDGTGKPFDFHEVIALLAPRYFFSSSPLKDTNFDFEGVKVGIEKASAVYRFLGADENIRVEYPDARHEFPDSARTQAFAFIDRALGYVPQ